MAKILIVEDDLLLINMYETKLKKENFEVLKANDGLEALEVVKKNKVDFIILDFMMPKLSGIDFLRVIRKQAQWKDTKVLMLSNMSNLAEMEEAKKLKVLDFLVKANYTPGQVVEEVKKYLRIK